MDDVRGEFDRIARLLGELPERPPSADEADLLALVPRGCRALEIGCGTGDFARALEGRGVRVTGIDLSPEMIALARRRAPHAALVLADFMTWPAPARFDCVVSIATLHHLPFEPALARMAQLLRPGGVLLVHDLVGSRGAADFVRSALAWTLARFERRRRAADTARPGHADELRAAWAAHGRHETHLPYIEIRRRAQATLPGCAIRRHLRWRYTLTWERPASTTPVPG